MKDTKQLGTPLPQLESKHIVWILDAARDAFAERVEKAETQIARHMHFMGEPNVTGRSHEAKSRSDEIESQREFLVQYRDILTVLRAMRERAADVNATEAAAQFMHYVRTNQK